MENNKQFARKNTNEMRKLISENPQAVIDEVNAYITENNISSITAEWDNAPFREKYNSYSAFSNVIKSYGYQYSQRDRMFIKCFDVANEQGEKASSEMEEILKHHDKAKYDYGIKCIRIDKPTYEEFDSLASQFNMSKSQLTTLMFKKFIKDLKESLENLE